MMRTADGSIEQQLLLLLVGLLVCVMARRVIVVASAWEWSSCWSGSDDGPVDGAIKNRAIKVTAVAPPGPSAMITVIHHQ